MIIIFQTSLDLQIYSRGETITGYEDKHIECIKQGVIKISFSFFMSQSCVMQGGWKDQAFDFHTETEGCRKRGRDGKEEGRYW